MSRDADEFQLFVTTLLKECLHTFGAVFVVIEFGVILLGFLVAPAAQIPLGWLLAVFIVTTSVIFAVTAASWRMFKTSNANPKVLNAQFGGTPTHIKAITTIDNDVTLLLSPSRLIATESILELHVVENGYEQLAGIAVVSTVQDNGLIQAHLANTVSGNDLDIENCPNWPSERKKEIVARPTVSIRGHAMIGTLEF